jgi:hypothetical protein
MIYIIRLYMEIYFPSIIPIRLVFRMDQVCFYIVSVLEYDDLFAQIMEQHGNMIQQFHHNHQ